MLLLKLQLELLLPQCSCFDSPVLTSEQALKLLG